MRAATQSLIAADQRHCWHPFTRQSEWCCDTNKPLMISHGEGCWLIDSEGQRYLDGNSSIWTNIHGHGHPTINRAIQQQLEKIAHSSFLGLSHPLAAQLANRLCGLFPEHTLERVFFSDNGSTAIECALKMALQYHQQIGQPQRDQFVAFTNSYHGDTLGAASLGGVGRFFQRFQGMGFHTHHIATTAELASLDCEKITAVVIEPLIQGVNEMRPWPAGMLAELRAWCDASGVLLILDEVMTGFGRTGTLFACEQEQVIPDFLCLAKGLTGGYLPFAATLTRSKIYEAFLGAAENTFYYGHSYTANPLGCAAALANLDVFESEQTLHHLQPKIAHLRSALAGLKSRQLLVHELRQCGFIAGIELRRPNGEKFPPERRFGEAVCHAARSHGLITRPILDTLVLMLPLVASAAEIDHAIHALEAALGDLATGEIGGILV